MIWKTVSGVISHHIGVAITYHGVIHGFWAGRGTAIAYLKAKLLRELMTMREEVLYEVFQDLRKAYNTLDQEIYLDIIITYGVGLWTERLLRR